MVLDILDRWLVKAVTSAAALDRLVLAYLADATADVLPAVDRTVQRGQRLLSSAQRSRR